MPCRPSDKRVAELALMVLTFFTAVASGGSNICPTSEVYPRVVRKGPADPIVTTKRAKECQDEDSYFSDTPCYTEFNDQDLGRLKESVSRILYAELNKLPKGIAHRLRCTKLVVEIHANVIDPKKLHLSYDPRTHTIRVPVNLLHAPPKMLIRMIRNELYHTLTTIENLFMLTKAPASHFHLTYPFLKPNGEIDRESFEKLQKANQAFEKNIRNLEARVKSYETGPESNRYHSQLEQIERSLINYPFSDLTRQTRMRLSDFERLKARGEVEQLSDGTLIIHPGGALQTPHSIHIVSQRTVGEEILLDFDDINPQTKFPLLKAFIIYTGKVLDRLNDPHYWGKSPHDQAAEYASSIYEIGPPKGPMGTTTWWTLHTKQVGGNPSYKVGSGPNNEL